MCAQKPNDLLLKIQWEIFAKFLNKTTSKGGQHNHKKKKKKEYKIKYQSLQMQIGWGLEQLGLGEGVSAHGTGLEWDDLEDPF